MAEKKEIKRISIVFGGGLSRGAVQLAFADEIIKKIGYERLALVSGSSIGALNAYATSVKSIDEMLNIYANIDCDSTRHFMKKIRNELYNDVFNKLERPVLSCPTYITGTRLFGLVCDYFCLNQMPREDLKAAINVSMSFPIINGPVIFEHKLYMDGGATDDIPVLPSTYYDPDMIIILHNLSKYYPPEDLYNKLPNTIIIDVDETLYLDKSINSFALAKNDFREMIRLGHEQGKKFSDFIFNDFDKENVQNRVYEYVKDNMEARHNHNADGLMTFTDFLNTLYLMKENIV